MIHKLKAVQYNAGLCPSFSLPFSSSTSLLSFTLAHSFFFLSLFHYFCSSFPSFPLSFPPLSLTLSFSLHLPLLPYPPPLSLPQESNKDWWQWCCASGSPDCAEPPICAIIYGAPPPHPLTSNSALITGSPIHHQGDSCDGRHANSLPFTRTSPGSPGGHTLNNHTLHSCHHGDADWETPLYTYIHARILYTFLYFYSFPHTKVTIKDIHNIDTQNKILTWTRRIIWGTGSCAASKYRGYPLLLTWSNILRAALFIILAFLPVADHLPQVDIAMAAKYKN